MDKKAELIIKGKTKGAHIKIETDVLEETTIIKVKDGELLDADKVLRKTIEICTRHGIDTIFYDPWDSYSVAKRLEEIGYKTVAVRRLASASD